MNDNRQHVTEGGPVSIGGCRMIARNLRVVVIDGVEALRFDGYCTDDPSCDAVRGTGYDSACGYPAVYGGNHLVYTWEIAR